jgi:hypothetical protein
MSTPPLHAVLDLIREHGPISQRSLGALILQDDPDSEGTRESRDRTLYERLVTLYGNKEIERVKVGKSYLYHLPGIDSSAIDQAAARERAGAPLSATLGDLARGKLLQLRDKLKAATGDVDDLLDSLDR